MGVPRIMPNWTILALKIETHGDLGIPHSKNPPYGDHHAMLGGRDYCRKVSFLLHSVSTKTVLFRVWTRREIQSFSCRQVCFLEGHCLAF